MTLTRDPKLIPGQESLGEDSGNHGKLSGEFFSLFFPRRKFSLDELFHQRPNFFFPEKFY